MERVLLVPPFDPGLLNEIVAESLERGWRDVKGTASWMLRHPDTGALAAALRTAWSESKLPLRNWAKRITGVTPCTNESHTNLALDVTLEGHPSGVVVQQAPFESKELLSLARALGGIPEVLVDVGLACPGLRLDDMGVLAPPDFYLRPLAYTRHYVDFQQGYLPAEEANTPLRLGLRSLLMEVAGDGAGNCLILGRDGAIYYFDHLESEDFRRCRVSLATLVGTYFESPESVFDPDFLGL